VVLGAAAGPVGSVVGQLARITGTRVVGVASGPHKTAYLRDELGFDVAIDRREPDLAARIAAATPTG
jgi:NADPH-dependent curcumin reductase